MENFSKYDKIGYRRTILLGLYIYTAAFKGKFTVTLITSNDMQFHLEIPLLAKSPRKIIS